jgi:photosystem II stability/assembly factor-like uncharacterized protein
MRRVNLIVSAALISILISISTNAGSSSLSWHPSGYGGGGRFTAIAIDPTNPKTVYVGSDVAGIFRSRDGGNRFELIGKGLGGFGVADIAINPLAPHQLVALSDDGLYYSINQGDDWIRISGEITVTQPSIGSRRLLFTRNSLWFGTDKKGIFKLPLNNLNASPQPVPGLERFKVNGLTVHDGYLYAGTNNGVYRLEGQVWKSQNKGLLEGSTEITDIAASQNSLYMVEKKNGLYRWNASALAWENRPVSLFSLLTRHKPKGYKSLLVHPNNPDLVFIGSHPENWPHLLYKSQDGGSSWKSIVSFKADPEGPLNWHMTLSSPERMAFIPGTPQSLFIADWWNVWQSNDSGENWNQKHHGLQNVCVNDVKVHPRNPKSLYLCASDNGLMISEDSGKHWRRAMNGAGDGHAQAIVISKKDPSRMFLLKNIIEKKGRVYVYESSNSGANWNDIGFSVPIETLPKQGYVDGQKTNLEMDPFSEDTMYLGTNGFGVYKTTNAGKTWSPLNQGLNTPFIKGPGALRVHPKLPGTLFASTLAGGIYKSTNGASSWQRVTTGERFTFGMAIDPSTPSRIVAGCAGNTILVSNDEGKTWQEIHLPVTAPPQMVVNSVAFHPQRPGVVLAGTLRHDSKATEGLFISTDGAKTFRQVPMDIPKVSMTVITPTAGEPAAAYIGFVGTGIFRVELGEKS